MQCRLKGPIPVFDLLIDVAIRTEDSSDLIGYISANNRVKQSYRVEMSP